MAKNNLGRKGLGLTHIVPQSIEGSQGGNSKKKERFGQKT